MYHFNQPATLVGVSELRTQLDKVLKLAKDSKVFLGKRQKPVAVIVPIEEYQEMEDLLDRVEDTVLGYMAKERSESSQPADYISLEEMKKRAGFKKPTQ